MIHNIDRYKPHWREARASCPDPEPKRATGRRQASRPSTQRCDVCGELFDAGHSYEVLHHLHGRRFKDLVSKH